MQPRKHAAVIKAWADGAKIQYRFSEEERWRDFRTDDPTWHTDTIYRVKPKEPYVVDLYAEGQKPGQNWTVTGMYATHRANLRLSFDPDSGELLSVEKI